MNLVVWAIQDGSLATRRADSGEVARAFPDDVARDSDMTSLGARCVAAGRAAGSFASVALRSSTGDPASWPAPSMPPDRGLDRCAAAA
jgi:hypothetical protein